MENEIARFVDALPGSVFTAPPDGRFDLVRSVLDDLPVLSAVMDASGRLEFANRQLLAYFGKSLEELKDWGSAGIIHPDDLPGVCEAWESSAPERHAVGHRVSQSLRRWRLPVVPDTRVAHPGRGRAHRPLAHRSVGHRRPETGRDRARRRETTPGDDRVGASASGRARRVMQVLRNGGHRLFVRRLPYRLERSDVPERGGTIAPRQLHRPDGGPACASGRRPVWGSSPDEDAGDRRGHSSRTRAGATRRIGPTYWGMP